jgi:RNA polymerase sigma factor (sigma-70 family)
MSTKVTKAASIKSMTDGDLLHGSSTNPELFGHFYDRHVQGVLKFFIARTACAHTAADLTAETFATALLKSHRYDKKLGEGRQWIYGIARNELMNSIRRLKVNDRALRKLHVHVPPIDQESLERIEALLDIQPQVAALRQALDTLPKKSKDAVILRVGHDLPFSEVASRLQCSEGAARVRVSRGLALLHEAFALQA